MSVRNFRLLIRILQLIWENRSLNAVRVFQQATERTITLIVPEEFRNAMCEVIVLRAERDAIGQITANDILADFTGTAAYPLTDIGETEVYEQ